MKGYFFKVPYGAGRSHWSFGRYSSKTAVLTANPGASEVMTVKQAVQNHGQDEVRTIARNCVLYRPDAMQEFPAEIAALLK